MTPRSRVGGRSPLRALVQLVLAAVTALASSASAQVTPLTSSSQISVNAPTIDFAGLSEPVIGQVPGVTFSLVLGGGGAGVTSIPPTSTRPRDPQEETVLTNFLDGQDCPCSDLDLTFLSPQNRIAFAAFLNPEDDLELSLFDSADQQIEGPLPFITDEGTFNRFDFIGVESTVAFSRVRIRVLVNNPDPQANNGRLNIDNLQFEPLGNPLCTGNVYSEGFELGSLQSWTRVGRAGVVDSPAVELPPSSGTYQAVVLSDSDTTVLGVTESQVLMPVGIGAMFAGVPVASLNALAADTAIEGSAMQREFIVADGDRLEFKWNFATNEDLYDDFAFFAVNEDVTFLAGANNTRVNGYFFPDSRFLWQTGWNSKSCNFSSSGPVTVTFGCINGAEVGITSALLVDCITITNDMNVPNVPPVCSIDAIVEQPGVVEVSPGNFVVTENTAIAVSFTGTDPDGESLSASSPDLPEGASLTPLSGNSPLISTFMWTPDATDKATTSRSVTVVFTDSAIPPANSFCQVTIADVNLNPTCSADFEVLESTSMGAEVMLSASASDPDDALEDLEFQWDLSDLDIVLDAPSAPATAGLFPIGSVTMATLTVTDRRGGMSTCDVVVTVEDELPPEVFCTTSVACLWPPNHLRRPVIVWVSSTDDCSDPLAIDLISVTVRSDEPDNAPGNGDGNTTGDTNFQNGFTAPVDITNWLFPLWGHPGTYVAVIFLRAERSGSGDGRAYTIDVEAADSNNNIATASCVVVVPHNKPSGSN